MSRNKVQEGAEGKAAPKTKKKKPIPKCGAKKKNGPGTCGRTAGWGTKHVGSGRCKLHGGSSTGPKTAEGKRKTAENAIKHGAYSDKILNDREQLLYDYLWDSTIEKHLLDRDDPMQMIPLQRACITYLKLIRLDEFEMEMRFVPNDPKFNPETGEDEPRSTPVFDLEGNLIEERTGTVVKLSWAKTPNWEGHFQRYMQMLGVDRGTKIKMDGMAGAAGQVVDAIGWLWGQKSQGDDQ